jgi:hypothetical protein
MLIVAIFTIAELWNQLKCSSTEEQIKKMWYMYTMEYYSSIEKDEVRLFAGKYVELESMMLSGKIKSDSDKYCKLSLIYKIQP